MQIDYRGHEIKAVKYDDAEGYNAVTRQHCCHDWDDTYQEPGLSAREAIENAKHTIDRELDPE